jgi:hypothetical protein
LALNIFSQFLDNFDENSSTSLSERNNSTQSRELEGKIRNLGVEVTVKERIIEEERAKIRNRDERIDSLVEKLKYWKIVYWKRIKL